MFDKKKNAAESYGVIGLGRFGTALVKTLAAAGKEVIAVDKDEAKVKAVRGYTDYAFVIDELDETSLKETGMQNCGTVTICIGEQIDISILTTMLVTSWACRTSSPRPPVRCTARCSSVSGPRSSTRRPTWPCASASG